MKKITFYSCLFLLILFISKPGISQDFPLNDVGKITFYEVVKADSIKKDTLYHNALKWLGLIHNPDHRITFSQKDSINGKLMTQHELTMYSQNNVNVLKKITGKITFETTVEVRNNLYRYTLTNFVFHYYKQDRNYKMVATGKIKNLEEPAASGWQKLWTKHRKSIFNQMNANITLLKSTMKELPAPPVDQLSKKNEVKWD